MEQMDRFGQFYPVHAAEIAWCGPVLCGTGLKSTARRLDHRVQPCPDPVRPCPTRKARKSPGARIRLDNPALIQTLALMALTESIMLPLGTPAPDFALPDVSGRIVRRSDFTGAPGLLVMFICNHCPYVKHVAAEIARLAAEYQARGVAVVGINANDASRYPADSPAAMAMEAKARGYSFPYLHDESQAVARAFRAACTPEFYLFDSGQRLVYRGRMDGSSPGNTVPVTGAELRRALDALLAGKPVPAEQHPGLGCSIKWKPGQEPDYLGR